MPIDLSTFHATHPALIRPEYLCLIHGKTTAVVEIMVNGKRISVYCQICFNDCISKYLSQIYPVGTKQAVLTSPKE